MTHINQNGEIPNRNEFDYNTKIFEKIKEFIKKHLRDCAALIASFQRNTFVLYGIISLILFHFCPALKQILIYPAFKILFVIIYPVYRTFKIIKIPNPSEHFKWLVYWINFALFVMFESTADVSLNYLFNYYYEIKVIYLIFILEPSFDGSMTIYNQIIYPLLVALEMVRKF